MHNFLFRKRCSNYSTFSPFGSSKNSKPGIIAKLKNKIQDLFHPPINPQSTIQPILFYNEQNLEKELSHQFQNDLVIVDRILPNNNDDITSKRRSIYPFDLYFQEVLEKQNQVSEEPIINNTIQLKDQNTQNTKTKKKMKFKKNHAKIQQSGKMEDTSQQGCLHFNKIDQNFYVDELNQENSSSFQSNYSFKKINFYDKSIETVSPTQKQEVQTEGQLSQINQFEIQSFANIKQNQQFDCQQQSNQKNRISKTQNGHSCNSANFKQFISENQYFSSSTGSITKGETQEVLFNMEHIPFSQESDSSSPEDQNSINNSPLQIQNKLYFIFHPNIQTKQEFDQKAPQDSILIKDQLKNNKKLDKNEIQQDSLEQQKNKNQKQRNLKLNSKIIDIQIQYDISDLKNEKFNLNTENQFSQQDSNTILNQTITQNDQLNYIQKNENQSDELFKLGNNQNLLENYNIQQQQLNKQIIENQLINKQQNEKLDSPQSQNTLMSMNYESTTINSNDQYQEQIRKNNVQQNQVNPFLDTSSHIGKDQISQYFLSGLLQGNSQEQQQQIDKNENLIDLFKIQTNNQLFRFNNIQDNQYYQDLPQNESSIQNKVQWNNQCQVYQQMEIIDQMPQQNYYNFSYQNNWNQSISNYQFLNFEQKCVSKPDVFQQAQLSIPWFGYQATNYQQSLLPQIQQSSYQISSINLFQSNQSIPNSNPNYCQEESRINHIYTQQDVLSLFQDANQKQDQNLFVIDPLQNSNSQQQNLNSSFTRSQRKKQRINNN